MKEFNKVLELAKYAGQYKEHLQEGWSLYQLASLELADFTYTINQVNNEHGVQGFILLIEGYDEHDTHAMCFHSYTSAIRIFLRTIKNELRS